MERHYFTKIKLIILIILLFLFIGCQQAQPKGTEEKVYIGTKGLEMQFMKDLPPDKMYDTNTLSIIAELGNKGTFDLTGSKCMVHLSGYDKTIIRGIDENKYCGDGLWGKSVGSPEGGSDTVEFSSDLIRLPEGVDSFPQKLILTACYEYETIANPVICINPNQYKINAIEEACTVNDVSLSGGQGAPVEVSKVEVDMIGEDSASFVIYISNVGGGTVIRPGISVTGSSAHSCPFDLEYDDYNIVDYSVGMSGGSMIKCSPEEVRLVNNQARLFCRFSVSGENAYTTPLQIRLSYNYMDSISKTVEIFKTPE